MSTFYKQNCLNYYIIVCIIIKYTCQSSITDLFSVNTCLMEITLIWWTWLIQCKCSRNMWEVRLHIDSECYVKSIHRPLCANNGKNGYLSFPENSKPWVISKHISTTSNKYSTICSKWNLYKMEICPLWQHVMGLAFVNIFSCVIYFVQSGIYLSNAETEWQI